MTDFDAATARTKGRVGAAFGILLACTGLAGCETASTILGGNTVATETIAQPPTAPAKPQMLASVALAPIIGAPDKIGQQLRSQVTEAAARSKVAIVADRDPSADYGMRGYLVAARDRGSIKVSYIWDVTDKSGKRVNRFTGEENVPGASGAKDPWSAVSPQVTQTIADKVAASLGAWAPSQPRATPVASAGPRTAPPAGAGAGTLPQAQAAVATTAPATTNTTTAALPPAGGGLPIVTGAPGDGNSALASALNRELVKQGLPVDRQTGQPYRIEGQVTLGAVKDGRQSIQIDWRVKDGKGNAVGTVTQKNAIPPGSLDGSWGQTADAAAAAAAQGILKLLPQQSAAKG